MKATMFRTFRQFALVLTITITSSFAVMPLVSFVRDIRSYSDLEAPGVAFVLKPDHGTAAIFLRNGSSVAVARVEGSQAYKDLMLRQNTTLATTEIRSNLQRPISDLWSLNKTFWKQPDTMEDIDKIALEPVLRGLKTAVEAYLGNSICFVKVALSGEAMKNDYLGDIVAGAVRQIGLVEVWGGRPAVPVQSLFRKWQDEGDFGEPESLLLIIDNSEYGFDLALVYQEDGLAHALRRNYHPYTGTESVTDKASSLQLALKQIMKPPFDYKIYYREVPQIIKELVIYGDNIWDPDFRNILDTTLESSLIRGAYKRQPVYAPALGLAKNVFILLNDPASTVRKTAPFGCCWKSRGKGCPKNWGYQLHVCPM